MSSLSSEIVLTAVLWWGWVVGVSHTVHSGGAGTVSEWWPASPCIHRERLSQGDGSILTSTQLHYTPTACVSLYTHCVCITVHPLHVYHYTPTVCVSLYTHCMCITVHPLHVYHCTPTVCVSLYTHCMCITVHPLYVYHCTPTACVSLYTHCMCITVHPLYVVLHY